jgi:hypothetical protein
VEEVTQDARPSESEALSVNRRTEPQVIVDRVERNLDKPGRMLSLAGLPVVRATSLSHGYAVGFMTSPAARARFGLPALRISSYDVKWT